MRKLLQHYETPTEEEAVAEDEVAFRRRDQAQPGAVSVMTVPSGIKDVQVETRKA